MSQAVVPSFAFDTGSLPQPLRVNSWREIMAATHDVTVDQAAGAFNASISLWNLDRLLVSHGRITGQAFVRSDAEIRRDHLDHIALFVQETGSRVSRTATTEATLRAWDVLVFDMAQPMASLATTGSSGTLYLPRGMVEAIAPDISRAHGTVLRSATARLLARHVIALGTELPEVQASAVPLLARATSDLALACITEHQADARTGTSLQAARRRLIVEYIESHLHLPELDAGTIGNEFGMSRTALYRLFRGSGGIHEHIKRRRLQRIRLVLLQGTDPSPIGDIALAHGFASESHFSREFRKAFGQTPGSLRGGHEYALDPLPEGRPGIERMFRQITG